MKAVTMAGKPKKLTPKQDKFCQEYMIDLNATQAAIRAGYSKKTAKTIAGQNLSKLIIQEKLTKLNKKRQEDTGITAKKVLIEAGRIAFADVGLAFDDDGCLLPMKEIPDEIRRAISGLEVMEVYQGKGKDREVIGYLKKVKFWSKDKQIEHLFRHLDLFEKDNTSSRQDIIIELPEGLKIAFKDE